MYSDIPPEIQAKHDEYINQTVPTSKPKSITHEEIVKLVSQCTVRKTKPTGPMIVCHDMICFNECIAQTKRDKKARIEREESAKK